VNSRNNSGFMNGNDGHRLLKQLAKALIERPMSAELSHHPNYERHDPAGLQQREFAQRNQFLPDAWAQNVDTRGVEGFPC
jgi:transposase-like protein